MSIYDLTINELKRAAAIKEQIEALNRQLRGILGASANGRAAPKNNRTMSAATKRKIAASQRARWAHLRRAKGTTRPAGKAKRFAKSAATRAKLSAKLKAYWAAKRAGKQGRVASRK